ncbi:hypothetical protein LCI18_015105 [Fusarium solani-melongenae]|uniref:Uncharacterized protein n=1 Tax=Fusarium solani subsp. cucurbitae TaxID=2747967 RepID=A0ACD3ZSV1_FUSSC|nr:hypothetical protein LCI18_015105 [Fusarium solani-melongenae]
MRRRRVKKNTPDDKLVEKCNKMTKQSCSPPGWDFYKDQEIHIEDNCPALIVDMEQSTGSVWFSQRITNTCLDMVGQDNKGMVIVCFGDDLQVVYFGECRVGKVLKTDSSATKLSLVDRAEEIDLPR